MLRTGTTHDFQLYKGLPWRTLNRLLNLQRLIAASRLFAIACSNMQNRKSYPKNRLCRCLKKHLVSKYKIRFRRHPSAFFHRNERFRIWHRRISDLFRFWRNSGASPLPPRSWVSCPGVSPSANHSWGWPHSRLYGTQLRRGLIYPTWPSPAQSA